jgi:hypothetical protein
LFDLSGLSKVAQLPLIPLDPILCWLRRSWFTIPILSIVITLPSVGLCLFIIESPFHFLISLYYHFLTAGHKKRSIPSVILGSLTFLHQRWPTPTWKMA